MKKYAFFDVDLTITKVNTFIIFISLLIKEGYANAFLWLKCFWLAICYALRSIGEVEFKERALACVDGRSADELAVLSRRLCGIIAEKYLLTDAINEMRRLEREGCKIVLVSASPSFYLQPLAEVLGVSAIMGTDFLFDDGVFRAQVVGKNCKGEEKVLRIREFFASEKSEADFSASYAYSDSVTDLPMLSLVANRFLINSKKRIKGVINLSWR